MKKALLGIAFAMSLWSGAALAAVDPFASCEEAANYGYDLTRSMVSASYNRADCDPAKAAHFEHHLENTIPSYLGGVDTTLRKAICLFQGSYEGWLDALQDEYSDCEGVVGFEGIPRSTLGGVASALLEPLWDWEGAPPDGIDEEAVSYVFDYDYASLELTGEQDECEARIRGELVGVPQNLVGELVEVVCD